MDRESNNSLAWRHSTARHFRPSRFHPRRRGNLALATLPRKIEKTNFSEVYEALLSIRPESMSCYAPIYPFRTKVSSLCSLWHRNLMLIGRGTPPPSTSGNFRQERIKELIKLQIVFPEHEMLPHGVKIRPRCVARYPSTSSNGNIVSRNNHQWMIPCICRDIRLKIVI